MEQLFSCVYTHRPITRLRRWLSKTLQGHSVRDPTHVPVFPLISPSDSVTRLTYLSLVKSLHDISSPGQILLLASDGNRDKSLWTDRGLVSSVPSFTQGPSPCRTRDHVPTVPRSDFWIFRNPDLGSLPHSTVPFMKDGTYVVDVKVLHEPSTDRSVSLSTVLLS